MQRSTIERVIDSIDSALGPDTDAALVEQVASRVLTDLSTDSPLNITEPVPDQAEDVSRWAFPLQSVVHISLNDCTSRLSGTVVAKAYDKIRRSTGSIPALTKRHFQQIGIRVPPATLVLHHTANLLEGFRTSDCIEIVSVLEQAAVDSGFDRLHLMDINLEREGSQMELLRMVPSILKATTISCIQIQAGSSRSGIRALELHTLASVLLASDGQSETLGPRITVTCNTSDVPSLVFAGNGTDMRLDLHISTWPLLDAVRTELRADACFGDRTTVLGAAGRQLYSYGMRVLGDLAAAVSAPDGTIDQGVVSLSLDAPGEGPGASGIWAGFPTGHHSDGSASLSAAVFLRSALLSDVGESGSIAIVSDDQPLSYSLRNVQAVAAETSVSELAGHLLGVFSPAVKDRQFRSMRIACRTEAAEADGVQVPGVGGTVTYCRCGAGWLDRHFLNGGTILPPSNRPR